MGFPDGSAAKAAISQFSRLIMSDLLRPYGRQHARLPCPSPTPRACSNSCPLSPWCHPTISSSVYPLLLPPSVFPSIRVFFKESILCIRWPKYWNFSFSISPSSEYSGLISFRVDWLYLLAVQGTLKRLLQHHSSKASILHCSVFFMVQLSHWYMTTGKAIVLSIHTFAGNVMSPLLFIYLFLSPLLNMLSRFVIAFLPRSKHLLISWLQEAWIWSLGGADPLEMEMATYSSILVWKIPWAEEPGRQQSMGSQRVRYLWETEQEEYPGK